MTASIPRFQYRPVAWAVAFTLGRRPSFAAVVFAQEDFDAELFVPPIAWWSFVSAQLV
ncbi:hypothetical protein [Ensifer canadensis]